MSKNKKPSAGNPPLSPEKYIKTKGRLLPIHECLINPDWEVVKTANIVIARMHPNGNITACIYSVDLSRSGVLGTDFHFNYEKSEYEEFISSIKEQFELQVVDYVLVHNIIFGAVDFADLFNIMPHKDFTKTTQYFLEEDTDDIEFIEIDFGKRGLPVFSDTDDDFDDDFEELEDEKYAYFKTLEPLERRMLFQEMSEKEPDINNHQDFIDLIKLANTIVYLDLCDPKIIEGYLAYWDKIFDLLIVEETELNDIELSSDDETNETLFDFIECAKYQMSSDSAEIDPKIKEIMKNYSNNPYMCYLYLKMINTEENNEIFATHLDQYCTQFPDYPLLKMENIRYRMKNNETITAKDILPKIIFKGRKEVTDFELYQYILLKTSVESKPGNFNFLQAIEDWTLDQPIDEEFKGQILVFLQMLKLEYLKEYFLKK